MGQDTYTQQFNVFNEKFMQYLTYIGIQMLFLINVIKTHSEINYHRFYKNNDSFHKFIDTLQDNTYYVQRLIMPYYIEAPFSYFKVCYKDHTYKEEYINMDSILYDKKISPALSGLDKAYRSIFSVIKPMIKTNDLEYLVLLHCRNLTYDYILARLMYADNKFNAFDNTCDTIPTKNYFLSIEYEHPNMKNSISFNFDKRYLIAGNELFSPCFVLKCLNYQNEPYVFDNDYKLIFLDSDINTTTLSSNQYIRLTNTKYDIIELKSNNITD